MDGMCGVRRVCGLRRTGGFLVIGAALTAATVTGCGKRVLTIEQEGYVNTAVHRDRSAENRTGEPLEVNVVCVYPGDLKGRFEGINDALAADSGITSDVWYENRPQPGDSKPKNEEGVGEREGRFWLPKNHVFIMTDETNAKKFYGTRIGPDLRGAHNDGEKPRVVEFAFDGLFASDSVIYIFPKFIGPNGEVLPVHPVRFNPPGDYRRHLFVKVGVYPDKYTHVDENYGQYIEIDHEKCPRHFGKDKEEQSE